MEIFSAKLRLKTINKVPLVSSERKSAEQNRKIAHKVLWTFTRRVLSYGIQKNRDTISINLENFYWAESVFVTHALKIIVLKTFGNGGVYSERTHPMCAAAIYFFSTTLLPFYSVSVGFSFFFNGSTKSWRTDLWSRNIIVAWNWRLSF